jgi:uncharacterized RDD family membrane protein YckC
MNAVDAYIARVMDAVPPPLRMRMPIADDLRAHVAERIAHGATEDEAVSAFGDPSVLATSYLQAEPMHAAGHAPRVLAKLIDVGVIVLVTALVALLATLITQHRHVDVIMIAASLVASMAYPLYTLLAELRDAQTLGKRWTKLAVVHENGTRISAWQSCVRQLPFFAQLVFIDAAFALFTGNRQRAVELLSHTRVIALNPVP